MSEILLEEQRENWGTRGGFVLAAVGSAVGLGNLWGFPYKIYSHGGGAFLIPYIIAMFVVGIPMLMMEFSLGHMTQRAAPEAFRRTHKKIELVGWWGILLGFIIIIYYPVVLAWCFTYLWESILGIFNGGNLPWAATGIEGVQLASDYFFNNYLNTNHSFQLGHVQFHILWPLLITWVVMYLCIFKGVSLVGKIVWITVPLPWLMLFVLTIRGLTLEGSIQGLIYYLDPDWTKLLEPQTWTYAFGQAFFSLSLAFGVMVTYSSFLHRKSDINNNAAIIGISDFATSFIAGIAVFATLGGMAFVTQQTGNSVPIDQVVDGGPGLAFVAFPYALAQLPYSAYFSFIFFFALITLGVDSGFSITESVLASIVDKTGWKRSIVLPVMSLIGFCIGIFFVTQGGLNWLGLFDSYVNGTWGIAFIGLIECAVVGWMGDIEKLRKHANSRSDWTVGKWWNFFIRVVIPVLLGCLFFWNLYNDITAEGGFLQNDQGQWIMHNLVGMIVFVVIVPLVAIILSLVKSPIEKQEQMELKFGDLEVRGRAVSTVSLIFSLTAFAIYMFVFYYLTQSKLNVFCQVLLLAALLLSITGISGAGNMIDKYLLYKGIRSSWRAKWAGFIGVIGIGGYASVQLINYTVFHKATDVITKQYPEHLTEVSYLILGLVLFVIFGGLAWCFIKAISASSDESQNPDEQ